MLTRISRARRRRRAHHRAAASVDFSGGTPGFDLDFDVQPGAAARPRRHRRHGHRPDLPFARAGGAGASAASCRLDKGRFTLGRASAAASVPQLQVRHVGRDAEEVIEIAQLAPWELDVKVAGGDLTVRGLGIDSRWTDRSQRSAAASMRRA